MGQCRSVRCWLWSVAVKEDESVVMDVVRLDMREML